MTTQYYDLTLMHKGGTGATMLNAVVSIHYDSELSKFMTVRANSFEQFEVFTFDMSEYDSFEITKETDEDEESE